MNKNESKYFKSAEKMHTALLTLLDSKDFELISVKEICETAGVGTASLLYKKVMKLGNLW